MRLLLWAASLKALSLLHRDPADRDRLRGLADELARLGRDPTAEGQPARRS